MACPPPPTPRHWYQKAATSTRVLPSFPGAPVPCAQVWTVVPVIGQASGPSCAGTLLFILKLGAFRDQSPAFLSLESRWGLGESAGPLAMAEVFAVPSAVSTIAPLAGHLTGRRSAGEGGPGRHLGRGRSSPLPPRAVASPGRGSGGPAQRTAFLVCGLGGSGRVLSGRRDCWGAPAGPESPPWPGPRVLTQPGSAASGGAN